MHLIFLSITDNFQERNCSKDYVCDILRDLVPFVQFKKGEKHPWKSVTFSCRLKPATLLKVTLLHGSFLRFLNCKIDTKSRKVSDLIKLHATACFFTKLETPVEISMKISCNF